MNALTVYESMFGNTRDIALAIAEGLSEIAEVDVFEVGIAPGVISGDIDILIAGGPTHQFGMSRASSREMARSQTEQPIVSQGWGVREWLKEIEPARTGIKAAAFDTTMEKPAFLKYMGRASRRIIKGLKRKGFIACAPPESFWVSGGHGPLADGELARARTWATQLASQVMKGERTAVAVP